VKKELLIIAALAAAVAFVPAGIVFGGQEAPPPAPEWVDPATGKSIPSKVPEFVNVIGPDGELVRCANGKLLKARPMQPPTAAPLRGVPIATPDPDEVLVPRCGKGANGHLNPVVVPISADPLRQDG
jgi:hypothetical protein